MVCFMASCSKTTTVTVENFKQQAAKLVNKEVVITGVANHICSHSGRKLFLVSENGGDEMVTVFSSPDMKPFDKETIGKTYTVKGIVKITQTIDIDYLNAWENEVLEKMKDAVAVDAELVEALIEDESHCDTEAKAAGIVINESDEQKDLAQIKAFRNKIMENDGKPLVYYHIECNSFEIN